jgi:hypothetical protein
MLDEPRIDQSEIFDEIVGLRIDAPSALKS